MQLSRSWVDNCKVRRPCGTFNGTAGTITMDGRTTIYVTVPATATSGYIVLTTPGGVATSPSVFDVT